MALGKPLSPLLLITIPKSLELNEILYKKLLMSFEVLYKCQICVCVLFWFYF